VKDKFSIVDYGNIALVSDPDGNVVGFHSWLPAAAVRSALWVRLSSSKSGGLNCVRRRNGKAHCC